MIRGLLLALLPLVFGIPRGAQAAPRALLVEVKGSGWPDAEARRVARRLEDQGFALVHVDVERAEPPAVDRDALASLAQRGLVALARGRLDEAESLLEAALEGMREAGPARFGDEFFAVCLDHARLAVERRLGEAEARARVASCRAMAPLAKPDPRRTPPEIRELVREVDAARVPVEIVAEGCEVRLPGADHALRELSALPGAELELEAVCEGGVRRRRVRVEAGAVVDFRPTLDERVVPGEVTQLGSEDAEADALALAARHEATVVLLTREGGRFAIVFVSDDERRRFVGATASAAVDQAFGVTKRAARPWIRRGAAYALGAAGTGLALAAMPALGDRTRLADDLGALSPTSPSYLALRDEFDAARASFRRRAITGGATMFVAAAISDQPLPPALALVSAGVGAGLLTATAAFAARAPACEPTPTSMRSCFAREVYQDRALLSGMAAAPFVALATRAFFRKPGRGLAVGVEPGAVLVAIHLTGSPGPEPRNHVWSRPKE